MNFKKNSNSLHKDYWENKYKEKDTGWDIGYISTPLKEYFNQLTNKKIKILVPGAGNSYEAEYLYNNGFENIDVIDIATQPLQNFKKRSPFFPEEKLIQKDFFNYDKKYDLIIEQTFFCSLHPSARLNYVKKIATLLEAKGKLVGLLFDFELTEEGPPFGGSVKEYLQLFSTYFNIITLDRCYNSIKPRNGSELFFIFEKK